MTDAELVINLIVCGAVTLVSIFLLIVIKKNPRRNEKAACRKECEKSVTELKRVRSQLEGGEDSRKNGYAKTLRSLNFAKRLAQQIAYEDENASSGSVFDKVSKARDLVAGLRRREGRELTEELEEAVAALEEAVRLIDAIVETERLVQG